MYRAEGIYRLYASFRPTFLAATRRIVGWNAAVSTQRQDPSCGNKWSKGVGPWLVRERSSDRISSGPDCLSSLKFSRLLQSIHENESTSIIPQQNPTKFLPYIFFFPHFGGLHPVAFVTETLLWWPSIATKFLFSLFRSRHNIFRPLKPSSGEYCRFLRS
jgi:hypothetical protein